MRRKQIKVSFVLGLTLCVWTVLNRAEDECTTPGSELHVYNWNTDEDRRCCKWRMCPPGTEAVLCSRKDQLATCRPCPDGSYQIHSLNSSRMMSCEEQPKCHLKGRVVWKEGTSSVMRQCACNWTAGKVSTRNEIADPIWCNNTSCMGALCRVDDDIVCLDSSEDCPVPTVAPTPPPPSSTPPAFPLPPPWDAGTSSIAARPHLSGTSSVPLSTRRASSVMSILSDVPLDHRLPPSSAEVREDPGGSSVGSGAVCGIILAILAFVVAAVIIAAVYVRRRKNCAAHTRNTRESSVAGEEAVYEIKVDPDTSDTDVITLGDESTTALMGGGGGAAVVNNNYFNVQVNVGGGANEMRLQTDSSRLELIGRDNGAELLPITFGPAPVTNCPRP